MNLFDQEDQGRCNMAELIVYVNENGEPTGETDHKLEAHHGHTKLHLAFSCYIFNLKKELLVTQRAFTKKVWPGVWTNSVCGHPGPGESLEDTIVRRAHYELGTEVTSIQKILPDYTYKTPLFNGVIENEYCPVFVAEVASNIKANQQEIESYKWLKWSDFTAQALGDESNVWSYWCKDQIPKLEVESQFKSYIS